MAYNKYAVGHRAPGSGGNGGHHLAAVARPAAARLLLAGDRPLHDNARLAGRGVLAAVLCLDRDALGCARTRARDPLVGRGGAGAERVERPALDHLACVRGCRREELAHLLRCDALAHLLAVRARREATAAAATIPRNPAVEVVPI